MAEIVELVKAGKELGLEGEGLQDFVKNQQDLARDARDLEREKIKNTTVIFISKNATYKKKKITIHHNKIPLYNVM